MSKFFTMVRNMRRIGLALVLMLALLIGLLPAAVQAAPAAGEQATVAAYSGQYYYVQRGDTLAKIASYFGVSWQAIANANGIVNPNRIYVGQRLYIPTGGGYPSACTAYYTVQPGDTLAKIARYYGVNTYTLAQVNGIANINHIYTGQRLCIPGGYSPPPASSQYYRVRPGDTLAKIAAWHGASVYRLIALNGIYNPNLIYVGQLLRVW
ncbi:MAG: LysM peptidoglycan-binding domain-containing protein [Caldilineaceae bacterium]